MLNRVPHSRGASDLIERGVDRAAGLSGEPCIVSSAFSHPHGQEEKGGGLPGGSQAEEPGPTLGQRADEEEEEVT
jgi:hypothetical protein